ncbi:unnamed protein product [Soboliphyme baturini]|uniref:WD_REPEATS_REGION domain-containing protein n=1 Tax=Soboliphyme baturini TaxID=241478 RepID=A0A183IE62_9BILA|nr:unnamed protein product [Soboliphyme baturini]
MVSEIWEDPVLENYFTAHHGGVTSLSISPNGKQLDGQNVGAFVLIRLPFAALTLPQMDTTSQHAQTTNQLRFSDDARLLASCSDDCLVKLWDTTYQTNIHTFRGNTCATLCVEFHPGGCYVASCATDGSIRIWDLRMMRLVQLYKEHSLAALNIHFQPAGHFLASSSADKTVKLYDLVEGRIVYTLHGHQVRFVVVSWELVQDEEAFEFNRDRAPIPYVLKESGRAQTNPLPKSPKLTTRFTRTQSPTARSGRRSPENTGQIKTALSDIADQLSLITETVSLLEKRQSRVEQKLEQLDQDHFRP